MTTFDPNEVLAQFDVGETSDIDAICEVIVVLVRLRNAIDHRLTVATSLADRLGVPRRKRVKSMAKLLIEEGLAPHIAYRMLRVGRMLGEIPSVAEHASDGDLSGEHVDSIVRGLNHIRSRAELTENEFEDCVATLSTQAFVSSPKSVADKARALAVSLTPEEAQVSVAEDRALNEMSLTQGADGRFSGHWDFDCVTAARLLTAIDPLCAPVPEGVDDPRSMAKRRADALEQVIVSYLKAGDRPKQGGSKPNLLVLVPLDTFGPGDRDLSKPVAQLDWAGPISAAMAETLACDSVMSRVLVNSESVPLDLGTDTRVVPAGIRKAVVARDQCCIRCGRPAAWCDVHHLTPWSHGGDTSLTNSALLCREDHTWLHTTEWEIVLGDDGHPRLKPPADAASQELVQAYNRRHKRPPSQLIA